MVDSPHGKGVTFTIRSAPVGYAAEYLTCGSLVAIPMGFSLHMFMRVLYHICISIPSGGRSVLPTFWNIWYNCLIKLNALLFVLTKPLLSLDNGLRAGCGNVFCRVPSVGCCQVVVDRVRTFCFRAPRLFPAASKMLARSKNDRPDETRHNNPLSYPLRRSCERGDGRDFDLRLDRQRGHQRMELRQPRRTVCRRRGEAGRRGVDCVAEMAKGELAVDSPKSPGLILIIR